MALTLPAQVVLWRKRALLAGPCDLAGVHLCFQNLPSELPVQALIGASLPCVAPPAQPDAEGAAADEAMRIERACPPPTLVESARGVVPPSCRIPRRWWIVHDTPFPFQKRNPQAVHLAGRRHTVRILDALEEASIDPQQSVRTGLALRTRPSRSARKRRADAPTAVPAPREEPKAARPWVPVMAATLLVASAAYLSGDWLVAL